MKKTISALFIGAMALTSCQKDLSGENPLQNEALMNININEAVSRAAGVTSEEETQINNFDVFVFNKENGTLDAFKRANVNATQSIKATSGEKSVYVIANRQANYNEKDVRSVDNFLTQRASILNEDYDAFTMIGNQETELLNSEINDVSVDVSRLVAKVSLAKLKIDFSGTPLAGQKLENVKIYLKNVPTEKYFSGEDIVSPTYISGNDDNWQTESQEVSLLYDEVAEIADGSETVNHDFYPYSRFSNSIQTARECIRVVITADIDGNNDGTIENYTWSFPVNNLGETTEDDVVYYGVKANHTYSINALITRLGTESSDPDAEYTDIDYSENSITINVTPWITTNNSSITF